MKICKNATFDFKKENVNISKVNTNDAALSSSNTNIPISVNSQRKFHLELLMMEDDFLTDSLILYIKRENHC